MSVKRSVRGVSWYNSSLTSTRYTRSCGVGTSRVCGIYTRSCSSALRGVCSSCVLVHGSAVRELTTLRHRSPRACSSRSVALKAVQVGLSFCSTGRNVNRGRGPPLYTKIQCSYVLLNYDGACTHDGYKVIDRRIDRRYLYHTEDRKLTISPPASSYKVIDRRVDRICLHHTEDRKIQSEF